MASRRRAEAAPDVDVRAHLLARWRERAERFPRRTPSADGSGFYLAPWTRWADRLEAGEPVEAYGWELPDELRRRYGAGSRVLIEPDGALVVIRADANPHRARRNAA